jgi:hypothetical protein
MNKFLMNRETTVKLAKMAQSIGLELQEPLYLVSIPPMLEGIAEFMGAARFQPVEDSAPAKEETKRMGHIAKAAELATNPYKTPHAFIAKIRTSDAEEREPGVVLVDPPQVMFAESVCEICGTPLKSKRAKICGSEACKRERQRRYYHSKTGDEPSVPETEAPDPALDTSYPVPRESQPESAPLLPTTAESEKIPEGEVQDPLAAAGVKYLIPSKSLRYYTRAEMEAMLLNKEISPGTLVSQARNGLLVKRLRVSVNGDGKRILILDEVLESVTPD